MKAYVRACSGWRLRREAETLSHQPRDGLLRAIVLVSSIRRGGSILSPERLARYSGVAQVRGWLLA